MLLLYYSPKIQYSFLAFAVSKLSFHLYLLPSTLDLLGRKKIAWATGSTAAKGHSLRGKVRNLHENNANFSDFTYY